MTKNEAIVFLKTIFSLKEENIEGYTLAQLLIATISHNPQIESLFKKFGNMPELAKLNSLQSYKMSNTERRNILSFIAKQYQKQEGKMISEKITSCACVSNIISCLCIGD